MSVIEFFIKELREAFPEETKLTDELHEYRGWDLEDKAYNVWLEAFTDITNQNIHRRQKEELQKLLSWMERRYLQGEEDVKRLIDVSFAEVLMYKMEQDDIEWAWPLVPGAIKDLYIRMWGSPV